LYTKFFIDVKPPLWGGVLNPLANKGTVAVAPMAILEIEVPEPAPVRERPVIRAPAPQSTDIAGAAASVAITRNKTPSRRIYTVRAGDTLGRIAAQIYGDPFRWPVIFEANNIANPDLIYIDQTLFIP
jgi:nucleoid-associated protein YgaU